VAGVLTTACRLGVTIAGRGAALAGAEARGATGLVVAAVTVMLPLLTPIDRAPTAVRMPMTS
jgi:hypothetical protein